MTAVELCLEDGLRFTGEAFGAVGAVAGEVVFSTAMTGYVESLTDPSYRGQILVLTYPLVGGYGVPAPRPGGSIERPFESARIQVQGLVTQAPVAQHSHHASTRSLSQWLVDENVPGIRGLDTRALTRHLRERGTMRGVLRPVGSMNTGAQIAMDRVGELVMPAEPVRYEAGPLTVLVIDAGAKDNLVRSFLSRGVSVLRAPSTELARLAEGVDGVVIGSGPGDPKSHGRLIESTRALLGTYRRPIFGVCLGSQILGLAAGCDTAKLPYGHRGVNQPVQDVATKRCYVTSQNHGYAIVGTSMPSGWEATYVNLNDGTNEGLRSLTRPHFGVQFHPESHPGPEDTAFLFDDMVRLVHATRKA